MNDIVEITINGNTCEAREDTMLLDALRANGAHVPTLCNHPSLEPNGACRLCTVEVTHPDWNGWSNLVTSCVYPIKAGLQISTQSDRVIDNRRTLLELYISRCPDAKEVRALARSEGVDESSFPSREGADKCIMCGLCTRVCQDLGPRAISSLGRGAEKSVGPRPDRVGEDCTGCGACAHVCPTQEITMEHKDGKLHIWNRSFDISHCAVNEDRCNSCEVCAEVCPTGAARMIDSGTGAKMARIDRETCIGCGICAGVCAAAAIEQEGLPSARLSGKELDPEDLRGRVVVFACSRSPLPEDTPDLIRVPCIGRVSVENMLECVARGADGVLVMCRDQATCPTGKGGDIAQTHAMVVADEMAANAGLGKGRIRYMQPEPGSQGPARALARFKASLSPNPLKETYRKADENLAGMDHITEMRFWIKRRPELAQVVKPAGPRRIRTPTFLGAMNKRTITQTISLVLLHSSFWPWAQLKQFCNPVLSCHSCTLAWFACPVGVFVHFAGYHMIPFVALGTVLFLGVGVGRLLCGWVCPFGFLQDLLYKIPTFKFTMPAWTSKIKYGVLVLGVFLLPFFLGEQTYFSFCRICPAAALQSTLPNLISQGVDVLKTAAVVKLGLLVVFLVMATLSNRSFCKVLCPIGAILGPLNLIGFWKIKRPTDHCMRCTACDDVCPPAGTPSMRISCGENPNRASECILCYKCKDACPMQEGVEIDLRRKLRS